MDASNFILKANRGKNTLLDKQYRTIFNNIISSADENKQERWEVYNLIIKELLANNYIHLFEEFRYRITDDEDPNIVILDIINKAENLSGLVWQLKRKIDEYVDDDIMKKICL